MSAQLEGERNHLLRRAGEHNLRKRPPSQYRKQRVRLTSELPWPRGLDGSEARCPGRSGDTRLRALLVSARGVRASPGLVTESAGCLEGSEGPFQLKTLRRNACGVRGLRRVKFVI